MFGYGFGEEQRRTAHNIDVLIALHEINPAAGAAMANHNYYQGCCSYAREVFDNDLYDLRFTAAIPIFAGKAVLDRFFVHMHFDLSGTYLLVFPCITTMFFWWLCA